MVRRPGRRGTAPPRSAERAKLAPRGSDIADGMGPLGYRGWLGQAKAAAARTTAAYVG